MYAFFERLFDPLAPSDITRPPKGTAAFFWHFLGPIRGLLIVTLAVSGIAAGAELALYAFLGVLVDWMTVGSPEGFLSEHGWALAGMAFIALILRPVATLVSRGLINLGLAPGLTNRVRWLNHRYVVRQSITYFQNDFAGRIAQKVMQTGHAVREAVINVIDGVWFLLIYLIGTLALFAGIDWRLLLPVVVWTVGYALVIYHMVPPVRRKSAAVSESNSALTGRVVDSYTNIQSVKLFAHAEREDAFVADGMTATEARRNWFRLLDEVAAGEEVVVERGGRRIIIRRESDEGRAADLRRQPVVHRDHDRAELVQPLQRDVDL